MNQAKKKRRLPFSDTCTCPYKYMCKVLIDTFNSLKFIVFLGIWDPIHCHVRSLSSLLPPQVAPATHWPELEILILVVSAEKKPVSSSVGMQASVNTSPLIQVPGSLTGCVCNATLWWNRRNIDFKSPWTSLIFYTYLDNQPGTFQGERPRLGSASRQAKLTAIM